MAQEYTRWDSTTKIVSLRFSNVMSPEDFAAFETWQDDPKIRKWKCVGACCPDCAPVCGI